MVIPARLSKINFGPFRKEKLPLGGLDAGLGLSTYHYPIHKTLA